MIGQPGHCCLCRQPHLHCLRVSHPRRHCRHLPNHSPHRRWAGYRPSRAGQRRRPYRQSRVRWRRHLRPPRWCPRHRCRCPCLPRMRRPHCRACPLQRGRYCHHQCLGSPRRRLGYLRQRYQRSWSCWIRNYRWTSSASWVRWHPLSSVMMPLSLTETTAESVSRAWSANWQRGIPSIPASQQRPRWPPKGGARWLY